jgi:uncharacterized membrane protein
MSDSRLGILTAVLALAGAAVSGHIVWVRLSGGELACTTGGCATVQSSAYAEIAGIPVALAGLVAFLLLGATAFSRATGARAFGASLALTALAFSAYLLVIQLAVIEAVCDWCLASDAITSAVAVAAVLRLRATT